MTTKTTKTERPRKGTKTTTTKTQDVLVNLVVDRSGSMMPYTNEVHEGLNTFISEQAAQKGTARVSMTFFSTRFTGYGYEPHFDVHTVATDAREIEPIDGSVYSPGGGTPLYDAVGVTIAGTQAWLDKHPSFKGKVLCVIYTDGQENQSREYYLDRLNSLIADKTAAGWEFVFMGVGGSAWLEGNKITAIPQTQRYYDNAYAGAYGSSLGNLSAATTNTRNTGESVSSFVAMASPVDPASTASPPPPYTAPRPQPISSSDPQPISSSDIVGQLAGEDE